MTRSDKQRMKSGLTLLSIVLAGVGAMQAQRTLGATVDEMLRASVYNESTKAGRLRIQDRITGKILVDEDLGPAGTASFTVERQKCHQAIAVYFNGKAYRYVEGTLCPENFPDEQKTVWLKSTGEFEVISEDRE